MLSNYFGQILQTFEVVRMQWTTLNDNVVGEQPLKLN
jgi:hypothetical protein